MRVLQASPQAQVQLSRHSLCAACAETVIEAKAYLSLQVLRRL